MQYRAHIDGLRAVAVMAVFAFHLGIGKVSGGYVGVDVFFVISGYLISAIILTEVADDRFSFVRFYERRLRRIFPALVVMLAVTGLLAYLTLYPVRLKDFGASMAATAASLSNVYFWTRSGYFDDSSTSSPLLHTWSLGVEEQFYVLWPILLIIAKRLWPRGPRTAIIGVMVLSFAMSAIGAANHESSAFYLLHSRAWELAMGAVLASGAVPAPERRIVREIAATLGMALIIAACFMLNDKTAFPGFAALLPCLGSALVIVAGLRGSSLVGRALSLSPVVLIGRISYSLYLWHWPIIIFKKLNLVSFSESSKIDKALTLLLGLVIAWISWRFVEQPFRNGKLLASRPAVFAVSGISMAGASVIGAAMLFSGGMAWRYPPAVVAAASYLRYDAPGMARGQGCFLDLEDGIERFDPKICLNRDGAKKNYLLLGDSHAAHLWYGLSKSFPDVNFLEATAAGCRPLIGARRPGTRSTCEELQKLIFFDYLPKGEVDGVILAAAWKEPELPLVGPTLDFLREHGIGATVVGPIVMYDNDLPELMATGMLRRDAGFVTRHRSEEQWNLDDKVKAATAGHGAAFVSLRDLLCSGDTCRDRSDDGMPLQFDYGHLTKAGSATVGRLLKTEGLIP